MGSKACLKINRVVEAAQRLQAASHAAVVLFDGLKGLSENKENSGAREHHAHKPLKIFQLFG